MLCHSFLNQMESTGCDRHVRTLKGYFTALKHEVLIMRRGEENCLKDRTIFAVGATGPEKTEKGSVVFPFAQKVKKKDTKQKYNIQNALHHTRPINTPAGVGRCVTTIYTANGH